MILLTPRPRFTRGMPVVTLPRALDRRSSHRREPPVCDSLCRFLHIAPSFAGDFRDDVSSKRFCRFCDLLRTKRLRGASPFRFSKLKAASDNRSSRRFCPRLNRALFPRFPQSTLVHRVPIALDFSMLVVVPAFQSIPINFSR
jgi:hypothetical protein